MNTTVPQWLVFVFCGVILALLSWQAYKEFKSAYRKDAQEKTNKHVKGKVYEYGIILGLGIIAFIVVVNLKGGPLAGLQERIWGVKQATIQKTIESPFLGDVGK